MNRCGSAILRVELTPTKVRRIVQENTEISINAVSMLGAGFDFQTYLVNDEWVFRFPNTPAEADALMNENKVLNKLALPTATPVYEHWLSKPTGYPMPVAAYRVIRGESMESLDPESCDTTQLAKDIGITLKTLHGSVAGYDRCTVNLNHCSSTDYWENIDCGAVGLTVVEQSALSEIIARYRYNNKEETHSTPIHGDLGVEHIITNTSGRLVGIIDWSNASYGNRFKDFIGLWGWGGDQFVTRVLSSYDDSPNRYHWRYIRIKGLLYCLHRLKLAVSSGRTDTTILRNRFRMRIRETIEMSPDDFP